MVLGCLRVAACDDLVEERRRAVCGGWFENEGLLCLCVVWVVFWLINQRPDEGCYIVSFFFVLPESEGAFQWLFFYCGEVFIARYQRERDKSFCVSSLREREK
jgi:hypothetical protein